MLSGAPTRGERNNNPFDLMGEATPWDGLADPPVDDKGYCVFTTAPFGLRAGFLDLLNAWRRDGLRTIAALVAHFAPRAAGNDVVAYVADVSARVGLRPDAPLDLSRAGNLLELGRAFIRHEQGRCIYAEAELAQAVAQALAALI